MPAQIGRLPEVVPAIEPTGSRVRLADAVPSRPRPDEGRRWTDTGNPHPLLARRTAHERGPVSAYWLTLLFDGLPAIAAQLREDRILAEARAAGGDLLHIAAMFGLTAKPAPRYAVRPLPNAGTTAEKMEQ